MLTPFNPFSLVICRERTSTGLLYQACSYPLTASRSHSRGPPWRRTLRKTSFTLIPLLLTHPLPLFPFPFSPLPILFLTFPPITCPLWDPLLIPHSLHNFPSVFLILSTLFSPVFPFPLHSFSTSRAICVNNPAGRHWPDGPLKLPSAPAAHPLLPSPPVPRQKLLANESVSPAGSPWPDAF